MQPYLARPGMETGVFYIPIANLPFDTNWRQFKDWLREGCVVDHVQIFGPSTSGWIRVMGQHNFYGACDRLKEGVFHGRRIMFDDRNMSNPIMIKDVERQTISRLVRIRMIPIQKHRVLSTGTYSTSSGQTNTAFRTPDTARSAAEALGVKDWMSYKSDACFISEGITGGQPQKPVSCPKKNGDPAKKKRSIEKSKTSATPSSSSSRPSGDSPSSHQSQVQKPSGPVIARGSKPHSPSKSKEKKG
ncbi:hypothetical protein Landi51_09938 [Colletotrichum acutatum]